MIAYHFSRHTTPIVPQQPRPNRHVQDRLHSGSDRFGGEAQASGDRPDRLLTLILIILLADAVQHFDQELVVVPLERGRGPAQQAPVAHDDPTADGGSPAPSNRADASPKAHCLRNHRLQATGYAWN